MIGAAAGAAGNYLGEGVTQLRKEAGAANGDEFSKQRQYETASNKLGDLLRAAYPGISGGEYDKKLKSITPDLKDTPEDITKRKRPSEDLIKIGQFDLIKKITVCLNDIDFMRQSVTI